jgi:NADH dehydrogenase
VNGERIAITGGTGFIGRRLADLLRQRGHEAVLLSRRTGTDVGDVDALARAFAGCDAVAHLAGINRELGDQTYQRVHVDGTHNVVEAARSAGVRRIVLLSFLRARPSCGSPYHESKFAAEEIVRGSRLTYTVLKCGVIYGRGDHLLDHLSHALHTVPVFATVGIRQPPLRPTAVQDVAEILFAALVERRLTNQTVAVIGPETLMMRELVTRVGGAIGRTPWIVPMPVAFHRLLSRVAEAVMHVPLVSRAQVRMLAEGLVEAAPPCEELPDELKPRTRFTPEIIRRELPPPQSFGCRDLRLSAHCPLVRLMRPCAR